MKNRSIEVFDEIGRRVLAAWRVANFDERRLPQLALEALEASPPSKHVSYDEVIRDFLFNEARPREVTSLDFGQPALTVFNSERLYIEVLCWMEGTTSIHQHGFSGAFHVMSGSSIHTVFDFDERERMSSSMRLGTLRHQKCEYLTQGSSRMIHSGKGLIHSLFHLDCPSLSVVVRNYSEPDTVPQWNYVRGGVAMDPFNGEAAARRSRVTKILHMLQQTDPSAYRRTVEEIIDRSDANMVVAALEHHLRQGSEAGFFSAEFFAPLRKRLQQRFGDAGTQLFESSFESVRMTDLARRRDGITDRAGRYLLGILLNAPTRDVAIDLAHQMWGERGGVAIRKAIRGALRSDDPRRKVELLDIELELETPVRSVALDKFLLDVVDGCLAGHSGAALQAHVARKVSGEARRWYVANALSVEERVRASHLRVLFAPVDSQRQKSRGRRVVRDAAA